jgi:hypothetical protein
MDSNCALVCNKQHSVFVISYFVNITEVVMCVRPACDFYSFENKRNKTMKANRLTTSCTLTLMEANWTDASAFKEKPKRTN